MNRKLQWLSRALLLATFALPFAAMAKGGHGGGKHSVPECDPAAAGVIAAVVAGGGILLARRRRRA